MKEHPLFLREDAVVVNGGINESLGYFCPSAYINGAIAHFGNPGREERLLKVGKAYTYLPHYALLEVSGDERCQFLDALTTQSFSSLGMGKSSECCILDAQGRIEYAAGVYVEEQAIFLIVETSIVQKLLHFLLSMRFMMQVDIRAYNDVVILGTYGDFLDKYTDQAVCVWKDPWPYVCNNGTFYGPDTDKHPAKGLERKLYVFPSDISVSVVNELTEHDVPPSGMIAWEAVRISSARPSFECEGKNVFPYENDWIRTTTHLNKGCYKGQETIAKTVNLGRAPRRLTFFYLEGEIQELPACGTPIMWNGREAGWVTSSVRSADEGPVALGIIRRVVPVDDIVDIGNYRAAQGVICNAEGTSSVALKERPGKDLMNHELRTRSQGHGRLGIA
ncbi:MAG: hypothetical protein J6M18_01510 [Actinomycetaceae bacterium]|nr:hypothetical protein [Actinomycetaceae bacterium]